MALLCISYFIAISACLSVVGLLIEYALPATASRRWLWSGLIVISMFLPPFLAAGHSSSVISLWGYEIVRLPSDPGGMSHQSLTHNLLDCYSEYGSIFNWMWVVSLGVLFTWGLWNTWRVSQIRSRSSTTIVDGIQVLLTDSVGPATIGVWRSKVVVPRWVMALPGSQRQYVIRHEEEHRSARDSLLLCLLSILVCLVPWNLPLWWQLNRLRLAVEMDCDNRVVSALGNAHSYGELLFRVAEASSRATRLQPAFIGAGMMERRLAALLAPSRRRLVQRLAAPALAIALLAVMFSVPHPIREGSVRAAAMKDHAGSPQN
jgi:hypothetical protein